MSCDERDDDEPTVDEARADAKRNALSNIELRIEVDGLKGELAEARRLLEIAVIELESGISYQRDVKAFLAAPPAEQAQPTAQARQETVAYALAGHGVVEMTDDEAELICECGSGVRLHVFGGHESCEYFEHHCDTCHEAGICTAHVKALSKLLRMVPAPGVPPDPPVTGDEDATEVHELFNEWQKRGSWPSFGGAVREAFAAGERNGLARGRALGARDERAKLDMNDEDLVADVAFEVGQATKTQPHMGGLCRREHGEVEDRRIARHAILAIARRAGRGTP